MERAKILLIGAGGLGVFFTSRLASAGAETAVVARHDFAAASAGGYEVNDRGTVSRYVPDYVIRSAAECPFVPDYVLIAAKVLPGAEPSVLTAGMPCSRDTVIVLIQNGIGIENAAAEVFPDNELLSAVAYLCASRPESGKVINTGPGRLEMGSFPAGKPSVRAERLAELFEKGGAPCRLLENVQTARWRKLLWNAPFNPVSVLAGGADTGRICNDPELTGLCLELMYEVIAAAECAGIRMERSEAQVMMDYTRTLKPYNSSMLQDYLAGRPLEVEAILGNALRIAQQGGVSVPRMEACYALLKSVDAIHRR